MGTEVLRGALGGCVLGNRAVKFDKTEVDSPVDVEIVFCRLKMIFVPVLFSTLFS